MKLKKKSSPNIEGDQWLFLVYSTIVRTNPHNTSPKSYISVSRNKKWSLVIVVSKSQTMLLNNDEDVNDAPLFSIQQIISITILETLIQNLPCCQDVSDWAMIGEAFWWILLYCMWYHSQEKSTYYCWFNLSSSMVVGQKSISISVFYCLSISVLWCISLCECEWKEM